MRFSSFLCFSCSLREWNREGWAGKEGWRESNGISEGQIERTSLIRELRLGAGAGGAGTVSGRDMLGCVVSMMMMLIDRSQRRLTLTKRIDDERTRKPTTNDDDDRRVRGASFSHLFTCDKAPLIKSNIPHFVQRSAVSAAPVFHASSNTISLAFQSMPFTQN
jgi:hypothetical protein